jgi:hypothetical protein
MHVLLAWQSPSWTTAEIQNPTSPETPKNQAESKPNQVPFFNRPDRLRNVSEMRPLVKFDLAEPQYIRTYCRTSSPLDSRASACRCHAVDNEVGGVRANDLN